jgi:hypothetical protein
MGDLLLACRPVDGQLVFAVDDSTRVRSDAECSPQRGFYYHPSRHSAGQPIVVDGHISGSPAGLAHDSWTAQMDLRRVRSDGNVNQMALQQVRALVTGAHAGAEMPLFVFDAEYDPVQLQVDLQDTRRQVSVRLRPEWTTSTTARSRSPPG